MFHGNRRHYSRESSVAPATSPILQKPRTECTLFFTDDYALASSFDLHHGQRPGDELVRDHSDHNTWL